MLTLLIAVECMQAQAPLPSGPAPKMMPSGPAQPKTPAPAAVMPQTPTTPIPLIPLPSVPLHVEAEPYSPSEFQRALKELKAEREALDAEIRAMDRRLNAPEPIAEPENDPILRRVREAAARFREQRERTPIPTIAPGPLQPKPEQPIPEPKKMLEEDPLPLKSIKVEPLGTTPVDPVQLAHTLFRTGRYEEALTVFRKIDLLGKKQEERAPIIYLTAECLNRVGKTEDAIAMLREVANSKGDVQMAECAQWQIDNLRWQRDMQGRLRDIRQRLQALEKR
ncbi:MAG TPA: hypothetical protein VFE62_07285 [Gemmataceae bacterium]|nr:hypothetical protein [Gemmataceae bacterium]